MYKCLSICKSQVTE